MAVDPAHSYDHEACARVQCSVLGYLRACVQKVDHPPPLGWGQRHQAETLLKKCLSCVSLSGGVDTGTLRYRNQTLPTSYH